MSYLFGRKEICLNEAGIWTATKPTTIWIARDSTSRIGLHLTVDRSCQSLEKSWRHKRHSHPPSDKKKSSVSQQEEEEEEEGFIFWTRSIRSRLHMTVERQAVDAHAAKWVTELPRALTCIKHGLWLNIYGQDPTKLQFHKIGRGSGLLLSAHSTETSPTSFHILLCFAREFPVRAGLPVVERALTRPFHLKEAFVNVTRAVLQVFV